MEVLSFKNIGKIQMPTTPIVSTGLNIPRDNSKIPTVFWVVLVVLFTVAGIGIYAAFKARKDNKSLAKQNKDLEDKNKNNKLQKEQFSEAAIKLIV